MGHWYRHQPWRECAVYAPYVVPRWTRWDASARKLRLVYTLSTELNLENWAPVGYQPQLMTARLEFP